MHGIQSWCHLYHTLKISLLLDRYLYEFICLFNGINNSIYSSTSIKVYLTKAYIFTKKHFSTILVQWTKHHHMHFSFHIRYICRGTAPTSLRKYSLNLSLSTVGFFFGGSLSSLELNKPCLFCLKPISISHILM